MKEKITVRQASCPGQFVVENNHHELEGDFLENYISFSGYFGKHGPYVFAAGPELVEALELVLDALKMENPRGWGETIAQAEVSLRLARGEE